MVEKVTSLTGSGVRDWLVQRVTAVLLTLYILFLVGYLMLHSPVEYTEWSELFKNSFMRIFTFLALVSVVYHTWVGMWTIFTDYLKCSWLRLAVQALTILALVSCLVWGTSIVWSII